MQGPPVSKGRLIREDSTSVLDIIEFQYNPPKYTESFVNNWHNSEGPGQFLPSVQFSSFGPQTFSMSLMFFGRGESVDVDSMKNRLKMFTMPGSRFSVNNPQFVSPGRARLAIGTTVLPVRVDSLTLTSERFDRQLQTTHLTAQFKFSVISRGHAQDVAYLDRIRALAGVIG